MTIDIDLQRSLRRTAFELADLAAARCLPLFRSSDLVATNKASGGYDPVTRADREAEAAMRDHLARHRPDDAILGEEFGPSVGSSGLTWVLDPIDGTRAFITGAASWGILVGLDAGEGPVLGLIDQPYLRERFVGGFGEAMLLREGVERPLRVRSCGNLGDAVLYTTYPEVGDETERAAFRAVSDRVRLTRYGLDCYAYALVAMGQIDLVIEAGLQAYDIQGPQAVIEAAGGFVTDWRGGPAHRGGRVIAAGDRRLHERAVAVLASVTG